MVAICVALFFGLLPRLADYAKLRIGSQVSAAIAPQNEKLDGIGVQVAQINGKLEIYDPMLPDDWRDQLKQSARLGPQEFKSSLGELSNTVTAARDAKIAADPLLVGPIGRPVFDLAVLHDVTHYGIHDKAGSSHPKAFAYGDVRHDQTAVYEQLGQNLNINNPRGDAILVVQSETVVLDGMDLRNAVIEDARIIYRTTQRNAAEFPGATLSPQAMVRV
jgi:hypothetical protein